MSYNLHTLNNSSSGTRIDCTTFNTIYRRLLLFLQTISSNSKGFKKTYFKTDY